MKFRLPIAGKLLLKFSVAEFARTLSTLLQGGLPILPALETTKDSVTSPLLAQSIRNAQREVRGGHSLSSGLRMSGFFPSIALDMIEVGESVGALPTMLESLAEFFEEDVGIDLSTIVAGRSGDDCRDRCFVAFIWWRFICRCFLWLPSPLSQQGRFERMRRWGRAVALAVSQCGACLRLTAT